MSSIPPRYKMRGKERKIFNDDSNAKFSESGAIISRGGELIAALKLVPTPRLCDRPASSKTVKRKTKSECSISVLVPDVGNLCPMVQDIDSETWKKC